MPPATLGDVLYAGRTPPSEQGWVGLVHRVAGGDQFALHALYARAHRPVFTLAVRILRNGEAAAELTLDVFHEVWRHAWRYGPRDGTVLGWIMNLARARALDRLRLLSGTAAGPSEATRVPAQDAIGWRRKTAQLRGAIADLTQGERQAIEAAFFAGLTHAEVAARLDQPQGTVRTRIRSGLHKLRQALAGAGV